MCIQGAGKEASCQGRDGLLGRSRGISSRACSTTAVQHKVQQKEAYTEKFVTYACMLMTFALGFRCPPSRARQWAHLIHVHIRDHGRHHRVTPGNTLRVLLPSTHTPGTITTKSGRTLNVTFEGSLPILSPGLKPNFVVAVDTDIDPAGILLLAVLRHGF